MHANRRPALRASWLVIPMVAAALTIQCPEASADYAAERVSNRLSVSGSLRTRWELWNWFEPSGTQDNDYDFFATVARFGAQWKDERFDIVVEGQNTALLDLPTHANAPAPEGALGLGQTYFAHNRDNNDASVFLKQAFLTWRWFGIEGLALKGGRFELKDGAEVAAGEPTLDWLKNNRIAERLVGPFGFSHVGRSFDGALGSYTRGPVNLTVSFSRPTQGGFDLAANKQIDEIDIVYAAANLVRPDGLRGLDARLFYLYYKDGRDLAKSDNRPAPALSADRRDIFVHSCGGNILYVLPTDLGPFDLLGWAALQAGNWGRLDHEAWAWDVEVGWQPADLPWKPWVRAGFGRSSGDDDAVDGEHNTFFQVLPTARIYALSTFYNLMNNEDAFAQLLLRPLPGLVWRTDFHNLRLTEQADLWYQGAGATLAKRDVGFGYSGRPSLGHRDLMRVVETQVAYQWGAHVGMVLYYGHEFGQGVVRSIFQGKDADYGFVEATLKF